MIIDCCTFLNEIDMLESRLEYLNNHVDYFVVVESNYTFNGNEKPYHIKANMDRFSKYGDRFIYVPHEVSVSGIDFTRLEQRNQWLMEQQQHNAMAIPLNQFDSNSIVIFGDLDEIPNRNTLPNIVQTAIVTAPVIAFEQDFFYFNFNQINQNKWPGTLVSTAKHVINNTPESLRYQRYTFPRIQNGGWHLSYWGSPRQIQYKINNFSHQEVNLPHLNNVANIVESITRGKDLYNRQEEVWLYNDRNTLDPEMLAIFSQLEYKI